MYIYIEESGQILNLVKFDDIKKSCYNHNSIEFHYNLGKEMMYIVFETAERRDEVFNKIIKLLNAAKL